MCPRRVRSGERVSGENLGYGLTFFDAQLRGLVSGVPDRRCPLQLGLGVQQYLSRLSYTVDRLLNDSIPTSNKDNANSQNPTRTGVLHSA